MPSGAKKRKAAKKKKIQQNINNNNYSTQSHDQTMVGEDEVKHFEDKESDGGEVSSPVSQEHHESEHPFADLGKREGSSSAQLIAPESDSVEKQDTEKVVMEEEGGVLIERELKLDEDYESKNISIESTEEVDGGETSSSSSSSGNSSSGSDDESPAVESKIAPVETEVVVDTVEPVELLPEVANEATESDKVEEDDSKVTESGPSVKLDDSLPSIVNQVNDDTADRHTDNGVAEAVQVVDLAKTTDCSPQVVDKVNDYVQIGETHNGDVETSPMIESEKSSIEETGTVTESASAVNPETCVAEPDLTEVGAENMHTLDNKNANSPELVDLGSESKELPSSENAAVSSDVKNSATEMQEEKLELSYNSHVGYTSNGSELVADIQNPEYSTNQTPVASTPQTVQKASIKSCCGIFELFTSSDR